ncbi:MAG: helix-turn-helix domain-containing protein [Saprospiraceae bacterium]|nr:hypothetical protein [Lewinella sp.]
MLNIDTRLINDLSNDAFVTLCHIAKRMGKNKSCWPGMTRLKKETGFGRHRLDNAIRELVIGGYIAKQQRQSENGRFSTNEYFIKTKLIGVYIGDTVVLSADVGWSVVGCTAVGTEVNKVLPTCEVLTTKEVLERKEGPASPVKICEKLILKHISPNDEILKDLDKDLLTLAKEIATTFISQGKELNPNHEGHIKGLLTYARRFIQNLPKAIPGESINMVEEVSSLFTKYMIRRPSERTKKEMSYKILKLMKSGETFDSFEQAFRFAKSTGGDPWRELEYTINNYDRLKAYMAAA